MNGPPSPRLSPTAGFVNALARLTIRGLDERIRELEAVRLDALELRHTLRAARDFADSAATGHVDRTGLEA